MTNKYNINDYVFFTETDIEDFKKTKITMGQVFEIARRDGDSGHSQIIYRVKPLYAVNHEKKRWEGLKSMDEGCLHHTKDSLECIANKAHGRYFLEPKI